MSNRAKKVLSRLSSLSITTWGNWLPILTFHSIDEQRSVISFPPELFQSGIAKLYKRGYQTLRLMEAVELLRSGAPFPDRSFVITFDDGYQSVYDEAFPILQRYGMSATVFLTVGEGETGGSENRLPSLAGRSMLSWHEIREMQRSRITFGAHTCTHPDLTRLPFYRVKSEVCDAKAIIEDALNAPVACFAYPYGRYDSKIREIVQQHFACACSDKLSLITKCSDLYALERVDAYYLRTDRLFNMMLTRLFPWYILMRRIPRHIRRAFQSRSR